MYSKKKIARQVIVYTKEVNTVYTFHVIRPKKIIAVVPVTRLTLA